jgi:hypothetical protein
MQQLPEYAKANRAQGEVVGGTNERLHGSPVTESRVYIGAYQDTHPEAMQDANGWTSAAVIRLGTRQHETEHIVRDPDLLAAMASQLLTASLQLRRSLEAG